MDSTFDKLYYSRGDLIAGMDESGVSDIAGPLVAACVILPKIEHIPEDLRIFEIDDSKKIPEKYRKNHAEVIWEVAEAIGVAEVLPQEIDYLGKRRATMLAMARALSVCQDKRRRLVVPDFLMVDGEIEVPVDIPQECIKNGDSVSLSIAAASIVAKVFRDDVLLTLHQSYPHYGWNRNKGHPCENQYKGMDVHGIVPGVHRTKFWPFSPSKDRGKEEKFWHVRRGIWKNKTLEKLVMASCGEEIPTKTSSSKELDYSSSSRRQRRREKSGKDSSKS